MNNLTWVLLIVSAELVMALAVILAMHDRFHAWLMRARRMGRQNGPEHWESATDLKTLAEEIVTTRQSLQAKLSLENGDLNLTEIKLRLINHFGHQITAGDLLDPEACGLVLKIMEDVTNTSQSVTEVTEKGSENTAEESGENGPASISNEKTQHLTSAVSDEAIEKMAAEIEQTQFEKAGQEQPQEEPATA